MRQREGEKTKPNEHHTGWVVVPGHEHPTADPAGHAETTDCHHGHPATPRAQTRPMPAGWATCPGECLLVRVPRHGSEDASTMKARATPLVSPRPSSPRALPDRAGVPARRGRGVLSGDVAGEAPSRSWRPGSVLAVEPTLLPASTHVSRGWRTTVLVGRNAVPVPTGWFAQLAGALVAYKRATWLRPWDLAR